MTPILRDYYAVTDSDLEIRVALILHVIGDYPTAFSPRAGLSKQIWISDLAFL